MIQRTDFMENEREDELISLPDLKFGQKFGNPLIAKLLKQLLNINKFNKIYSEHSQKQGVEFLDSVLNALNISYEISEKDIKKIPAKGAFITVSNYPLGGIDGLLLVKIITGIRNSYRMLATKNFHDIEPLKEMVFPVNPFDLPQSETNREQSFSLLKAHLNAGHSVGLFPAGVLSTFKITDKKITDRKWNKDIIGFIQSAEVPVVPVYFHGNNSWLFRLLGNLHPLLQATRLPSGFRKKKKNVFRVRIGSPVSVAEQKEFTDTEKFGRFLRAKTYALGSHIEVKKFFRPPRLPRRPEDIIAPLPHETMVGEIERLSAEYTLFSSDNYRIICAPPFEMSGLLMELGRLREITFREIGEGTNKSCDIDEYDLCYHQLIVWDTRAEKIVGAYRVGKGAEIFAQLGVKGFYIRSLFKISEAFFPVLKESLELGRSFIVKEYQRKPLSLFLLWKGILFFLLKNQNYRYLIGPTSISNNFSTLTKSLIVDFIRLNFYNHDFGQYITPKKEFKIPQKYYIDYHVIVPEKSQNINRLDKLVSDIEPHMRMPVLLKKYLKLNAKIIGFNIDPKFNDALDGLMLLDLFDVPVNVIESLSKEVNDKSLLQRFNLRA